MRQGEQHAFVPWKVIDALYGPVKERVLNEREKEYLGNEGFWEKTYLSDLETHIMSIPYDFIFSEHINSVKRSQEQEEYESFLTYFRSLKEQHGTARDVYNLLEHIDLYAQYLEEEQKNKRLAGICEEGLRVADELITTYQANNLIQAITTTLETKARLYGLKGQSQIDKESLYEGLTTVELMKRMNKGNLTPQQHNIQGEILSYLATMHQGQEEAQTEYIDQSMSCLEKALLDTIDEDFLLNYSNLYTLVEDAYTLSYDKKLQFQKRAREFMRYLQREHKDNEMINHYTDDLFDQDEDDGFS